MTNYTRLSMTTIWLLYMATMYGYMVITDITDITNITSITSITLRCVDRNGKDWNFPPHES